MRKAVWTARLIGHPGKLERLLCFVATCAPKMFRGGFSPATRRLRQKGVLMWLGIGRDRVRGDCRALDFMGRIMDKLSHLHERSARGIAAFDVWMVISRANMVISWLWRVLVFISGTPVKASCLRSHHERHCVLEEFSGWVHV